MAAGLLWVSRNLKNHKPHVVAYAPRNLKRLGGKPQVPGKKGVQDTEALRPKPQQADVLMGVTCAINTNRYKHGEPTTMKPIQGI